MGYYITLKDLSKLVIGSFYRPLDKGIQPLVDLEMELAQILEKFKNNPKTTLILGGDFNAGVLTGTFVLSIMIHPTEH